MSAAEWYYLFTRAAHCLGDSLSLSFPLFSSHSDHHNDLLALVFHLRSPYQSSIHICLAILLIWHPLCVYCLNLCVYDQAQSRRFLNSRVG
jgi:hypothetical protein